MLKRNKDFIAVIDKKKYFRIYIPGASKYKKKQIIRLDMSSNPEIHAFIEGKIIRVRKKYVLINYQYLGYSINAEILKIKENGNVIKESGFN
jgi:hypothetical protein